MTVRRSEERLAEAAKLYYVDGLTQDEVAKRLLTSRSNVSRMLQTARERRIIEFRIRWPLARDAQCEEALARRFGLTEAVVLSGDGSAQVLERTGELAARWLLERLDQGQTIALSWGRALQQLVRHVEPPGRYDVEVVQLGGDLQLGPYLTGHDLIRELAERLGGRYSYLHAPAIVDSPDTAHKLRRTPQIAEQLAKARRADLAVVGIGAYGLGSSGVIVSSSGLSAEGVGELAARTPVGDVCARFYDADGTEIASPLRERVLALELDELRAIPCVAGVACGREKVHAVLGALRGRMLDVLICDEILATEVLKEKTS